MTPEANKIAELEASLKASTAREKAYRADVVRLTAKVTVLAAEVRDTRAAFVRTTRSWIRIADCPGNGLFSGERIEAMLRARAETDAAGALA
jgi:hypothetical protein